MLSKPMSLFITLSLLVHATLLIKGQSPSRAPSPGSGVPVLQVRLPGTAPERIRNADAPVSATTRDSQPDARNSSRITTSLPQSRQTPVKQTRVRPAPVAPVVSRDLPASAATRLPASATVSTAPDEGVRVRARVSHALQRRLRAEFTYPRLARKRGWQGEVTLSLRIERDGLVSHIQVAQTSGYRILDASALQSAGRIRALPEVVSLLDGQALDLQVPVHYQLLDSQT